MHIRGPNLEGSKRPFTPLQGGSPEKPI
jgi:hypothetical protein